MERILELSELMTSEQQCHEYSITDRCVIKDILVSALKRTTKLDGLVADLGCGPADYYEQLCVAFPDITIDAYDGSLPMVVIAKENTKQLKNVIIKHQTIETINDTYDSILCVNVLHHIVDPNILWNTIKRISKKDTKIFVMDLIRPSTLEDVDLIVSTYAASFSQAFKDDFRSSLKAAFTLDEIKKQLAENDLKLSVDVLEGTFGIAFIRGEIKYD